MNKVTMAISQTGQNLISSIRHLPQSIKTTCSNIIHAKYRTKTGISQLRKQARTTIHTNTSKIVLISSLRALSMIGALIIGIPSLNEVIQRGNLKIANPNMNIPDADPKPFLLAVLISVIAMVVFDTLITKLVVLSDSKHSSKYAIGGFELEWLSTTSTKMLYQISWPLVGIIFFIVAAWLYDISRIWIVFLILSVVTAILAFLFATYAYRFATMIAIEKLFSTKQAMKESRRLMKTHRAQMFTITLSFIPWDILNIITFGITNIYVKPYKIATLNEFRKELINEDN